VLFNRMQRGLVLLLAACAVPARGPAPDIRTVNADLTVPELSAGEPGAGKRVKQALPGYEKTAVHHVLYLPTDWQAEKRWPVLVEYAGNGNYSNSFGDVSSGRPDGSKMGYGISGGKGFIWVCLPYLNASGDDIAVTWWGDPDNRTPQPTLDYCRKAVAWICAEYGGDTERVILCGFSRGAIACNYLGLHDDSLAGIWRGFVAYSHYDGVFGGWPFPGADQEAALLRLERLSSRPQFICQEESKDTRTNLTATRRWIESTTVSGDFTFAATGYRNHNDGWLLRPGKTRSELRAWVRRVIR